MVWIRGHGPVWRHCRLFMLVILVWRYLLPVSLVYPRQNWIRESGFRFALWMDGFTESNLNRYSDLVNQIRHKSRHNADCCYTHSVVSVCVSVGHKREPCENGWTDRDAVWEADSCLGPINARAFLAPPGKYGWMIRARRQCWLPWQLVIMAIAVSTEVQNQCLDRDHTWMEEYWRLYNRLWCSAAGKVTVDPRTAMDMGMNPHGRGYYGDFLMDTRFSGNGLNTQ